MDFLLMMPDENDSTCACCGEVLEYREYEEDPWEGRLDSYCENCAWMRCDAFPGSCRDEDIF